MRENEFEKRVQEKMNEFNLSPSAQVWTDVERRIRKEKKRRFIFWLPLFFLLVAGGIAAGIFFMNNNNKEKTGGITLRKDTDKPNQSSPGKTITPVPGQPVTKTNEDNIKATKPDTDLTGNNIEQTSTPSAKTKTSSGKKINAPAPGNRAVENKLSGIKKKRSISRDKTKEVIAAIDQEKDGEKQLNTEPVVTITSPAKQTDPVPVQTGISEVAIQPKEPPKEDKQPVKPVEPTTDSVAKGDNTKSPVKKNKKWDWGFTVSGGRSAVVNGFNLFSNRAYADALSAQPGGPSSVVMGGSTIRPSLTLSAGLFFKRSLSKKLDINLGAGYSFLSTKMHIGNRVDSARTISNFSTGSTWVNNYYRPAPATGANTYSNQYHFLSFSGELSWKIIHGRKFDISWDNGISYNRLLASNMLHYSSSLPGYYKNNRLLVKDQVFITTGITVPLSQRVWINPFASYGLTGILKNTGDDRSHFTQFGIRIKFQLKKK